MARLVPFIVTSFSLLCVRWIFFLDLEDLDSLSDAFVFMHSWWSRRESCCWKWLACVLVEVMPFEVDTIENGQQHPSRPWFFLLTKKDQRWKDTEYAVLEKGLWPNLGAHHQVGWNHQVLCWNTEMWCRQTQQSCTVITFREQEVWQNSRYTAWSKRLKILRIMRVWKPVP